jgi:hypothetical protein
MLNGSRIQHWLIQPSVLAGRQAGKPLENAAEK